MLFLDFPIYTMKLQMTEGEYINKEIHSIRSAHREIVLGARNTLASFNWGQLGVDNQRVESVYNHNYKYSLLNAAVLGLYFNLGVLREDLEPEADILGFIPDHRKTYIGSRDEWLIMFYSSISPPEAEDIKSWLITTTPKYVAKAVDIDPRAVLRWLKNDSRFVAAQVRVD